MKGQLSQLNACGTPCQHPGAPAAGIPGPRLRARPAPRPLRAGTRPAREGASGCGPPGTGARPRGSARPCGSRRRSRGGRARNGRPPSGLARTSGSLERAAAARGSSKPPHRLARRTAPPGPRRLPGAARSAGVGLGRPPWPPARQSGSGCTAPSQTHQTPCQAPAAAARGAATHADPLAEPPGGIVCPAWSFSGLGDWPLALAPLVPSTPDTPLRLPPAARGAP
mmetsp:Transcript_97860/g.277009  ORF Transcript_97860/g.277009 Transcript_97860/m.277009 type:complete len:225 (+) Transcript_97860:2485-3159(+)